MLLEFVLASLVIVALFYAGIVNLLRANGGS